MNYDIGDWQRAVELYNHYLELKPDDPDVLTDLGIAYRQMAQFDQALGRFKEAQKAAPDHWQSYYNEVVVLAFDMKRLDEAQPGPRQAPGDAAGKPGRGQARGGRDQAAQGRLKLDRPERSLTTA